MGFGNEKCKEIVENICPYCHEHLIMNKRSFANHIRWCKSNPKYEQILKSMKEKISIKELEYQTLKFGEIKEFKVNCDKCGKEIIIKEREKKFNPNKKYYCSSSCANSHNLSTHQKQNISLGVRQYLLNKDPNYVYIKDQIKICPICGKEFTGYANTCSRSCGNKLRYRKKLIDDFETKNKIYKKCCQFTFSLNDFPDEFDFNLIQENGWYKAKNRGDNLTGISRDHKYSCNEGFKNLIDPYIISHPANCQLLIHTDNISKLDKCSISIDELINNIHLWNYKYGEYPNKIDYNLLDKLNIPINIKYKLK